MPTFSDEDRKAMMGVVGAAVANAVKRQLDADTNVSGAARTRMEGLIPGVATMIRDFYGKNPVIPDSWAVLLVNDHTGCLMTMEEIPDDVVDDVELPPDMEPGELWEHVNDFIAEQDSASALTATLLRMGKERFAEAKASLKEQAAKGFVPLLIVMAFSDREKLGRAAGMVAVQALPKLEDGTFTDKVLH